MSFSTQRKIFWVLRARGFRMAVVVQFRERHPQFENKSGLFPAAGTFSPSGYAQAFIAMRMCSCLIFMNHFSFRSRCYPSFCKVLGSTIVFPWSNATASAALPLGTISPTLTPHVYSFALPHKNQRLFDRTKN